MWGLVEVFLNQPILKTALEYFYSAWFIWASILAIFLLKETWLGYIHLSFINSLSWVILEVKIPRDITKSPRAMELVFTALHNTKDGHLIERWWKGFLRPWYSFEIISVGGQIHFFIYTQAAARNLVESQIYAQYPAAEIAEVEDYSKVLTPKNIPDEWNAWGAEFALLKEEAYPVRTYIDFGLEAGKLKEEEKVDPLTSFLEALGALKDGEEIWFQIIMRGAGKDWKDKADKIIEELQKQKGAVPTVMPSIAALSPGKRSVLEAVERNVSKIGYEVGIRALYLAKKEVFNGARAAFLTGALRQYNTQNMNGFKPGKTTSVDFFLKTRRELRRKRTMIRAYQQRFYFYIPFRRKAFVLNTEALATLFHFPGRVSTTPTFGRIEAKKSEPPINLPI